MPSDKVQDGRDLMQNDGMGFDLVALAGEVVRGFFTSLVRMRGDGTLALLDRQYREGRISEVGGFDWFADAVTPEHPNYRYQHQRIGEDTV